MANLSSKHEDSKQNKVDFDGSLGGNAVIPPEQSPKTLVNQLRSTVKSDISAVSQKLGEIYVSQMEAVDAVQFHGGFLETISTRLLNMEDREREREKKIADLNKKLITTQEELSTVKAAVKENTKEIKGNNMIVNGLKELANKNCKDTAVDFLKKLVPDIKAEHLSNAYRMGKTTGDGEVNRALYIKFHDGDMKARVMKQKAQLYKNKNLGLKSVFCNDDLDEEARLVRQEMREIARFARGAGYTDVKVSGDKLHVQGKVYADDELHLLPRDIQLASIRTRNIGNGIGFFSIHLFLSNFYPAPVVINGVSFTSSEQAYQFNKAEVCGRDDTAKAIKASANPKKIKKWGDKIDTSDKWENRKEEVMRFILVGKFTQNQDLRKKLIDTGDKPLYECTSNRYWGTGWRLDAPQWLNSTSAFPGRNTLGRLLMEVRSSLSAGANVNQSNLISAEKAKPDTTLQEISEKGDREGQLVDNKVIDTNPLSKNRKVDEKEKPNAEQDEVMGATGGVVCVASSTSSVSSSCIMEVDSSSVDSEVFNRSSFSAKSIIRDDGHLDRDKLLGWALPTIDTSRLREMAAKNFPDMKCKGGRYNPDGTSGPTQSTPVTHVTRRKSKKMKKATETVAENKWNILSMLDKGKEN